METWEKKRTNIKNLVLEDNMRFQAIFLPPHLSNFKFLKMQKKLWLNKDWPFIGEEKEATFRISFCSTSSSSSCSLQSGTKLNYSRLHFFSCWRRERRMWIWIWIWLWTQYLLIFQILFIFKWKYTMLLEEKDLRQ